MSRVAVLELGVAMMEVNKIVMEIGIALLCVKILQKFFSYLYFILLRVHKILFWKAVTSTSDDQWVAKHLFINIANPFNKRRKKC